MRDILRKYNMEFPDLLYGSPWLTRSFSSLHEMDFSETRAFSGI